MIGFSGAASAQTDSRILLSKALKDLARRAKVELIYDPALIAEAKVVPVARSTSTNELTELLSQTRFNFREVGRDTYVIVARPRRAKPFPDQVEPSTVPEILVEGRRSLNLDLVRSRDAVQPYWIASGEDVARSGADTVDEFLRSRMTLNRSTAPLTQGTGAPRSNVNLRGFGTDQTLILVDGRRVASMPVGSGLVGQSDVNGIPVEAVDRVETLATSAGGIFGLGATGGVVNLVLKRDYHGLLLSADSAITARGDGLERHVYGRLGWTTPNSRTHVMISGSYARDDGLLQGQRSYAVDWREKRIGLVGYLDAFASPSINIRSSDGSTLIFKPAYGGGSLNSSVTYLPVGASALNAGNIALLKAHAGLWDTSLSTGAQGKAGSLIAPTTRLSITGSFRQDLWDGGEAFVDYFRLDDRAYQTVPLITPGSYSISIGSAANPFTKTILITFPTTLGTGFSPERDLTQRVSAGLIQRFSSGWSLDLDGTLSTSTLDRPTSQAGLLPPTIFPTFDSLIAAYNAAKTSYIHDRSTNRLVDMNFRLSGPIGRLPGGPSIITLSSEYRRQSSGGYGTTLSSATTPTDVLSYSNGFSESVISGYGEAQLPFLDPEGPLRPWRSLTGQVAVRLDRYSLSTQTTGQATATQYHASVLGVTTGLQSHPVDGLMLRASYSTAATVPSPSQIITYSGLLSTWLYHDPKRGGAFDPASSARIFYLGGNLRPQKTYTLSFGAVLEPQFLPGLRVSIDYTSLATHNEVTAFAGVNPQFFVDHEALYPDRIVRAALTDADKALGYTGGRIISLNSAPLATGRSKLNAIDFSLSYERALGKGHLRLQAETDWVLSFRRMTNPDYGYFQLVGYADGPVALHTSAFAEWATRRFSITPQVQIYSGYSLATATPPTLTNISTLTALGFPPNVMQAYKAGEPHMPAQAYFDLSIAFLPQGKDGIRIRAAIQNLFDHRAPIAASAVPLAQTRNFDATPTSGTAAYGDLLGRRFSISATVPFQL